MHAGVYNLLVHNNNTYYFLLLLFDGTNIIDGTNVEKIWSKVNYMEYWGLL